MIEWINVKDRTPQDGETVLATLNTVCRQPFVARFLTNYHTSEKVYKNAWFLIPPPRFPKQWLFTEGYCKAFRLKKNQVSHWMYLPQPPDIN